MNQFLQPTAPYRTGISKTNVPSTTPFLIGLFPNNLFRNRLPQRVEEMGIQRLHMIRHPGSTGLCGLVAPATA